MAGGRERDPQPADGAEARVVVLAPSGRDADLAADALEQAGVAVRRVTSVHDLARSVTGGDLGAILVTEESLADGADETLETALGEQPPWSDLPVVLLTSPSTLGAEGRLSHVLLRLGNVTLLERPMRRITLLTAVHMALRQRRHQYELREVLEAQRNAVTQRDHFLAMLGHELRNPLAAIRMVTEVVDVDDPESYRRHCHIVARQSRHLQRLVDDLLEVTRISRGKISIDRAPLDLREVARHALESLDGSIKRHHLQLVFEADPGPVGIVGDAVRLEQVINNLVANAIRFTPAGGRIEVRVRRENGAAVLQVSDTGEGIPPEDLPRIFDLFAQVDESGDHRGGLGIGLALVEQLVRLHGGAVAAYSEGLNTGSHFVVRLPLRTAMKIAEGPDDGRGVGDGNGGPPRPRVVLVEDDDDNRELLRLLLERRGFAVRTAANGQEAIEVIGRDRPGIALIDLGLPDVDGYEVGRQARRILGGSALLIALTGYGHAEAQRRTREAGFDVHLTKPLDLDAFERLAREARPRPPAQPEPPPP
jgi:signal transduction histidine kinase/CheY-like chemotaxis protein